MTVSIRNKSEKKRGLCTSRKERSTIMSSLWRHDVAGPVESSQTRSVFRKTSYSLAHCRKATAHIHRSTSRNDCRGLCDSCIPSNSGPILALLDKGYSSNSLRSGKGNIGIRAGPSTHLSYVPRLHEHGSRYSLSPISSRGCVIPNAEIRRQNREEQDAARCSDHIVCFVRDASNYRQCCKSSRPRGQGERSAWKTG